VSAPIGFLGLGSIGRPMAENLAAKGFAVLGFDIAPRERWAGPPVTPAASLAEVAQAAEVVLLSLPDPAAARGAIEDLIAAPGRRVRIVGDLSTIGVQAAREFDTRLRSAGIAYADAPVSGGVSGARAAKLATMCAAPAQVFAELAQVFETFSARVFHVGEAPGQGQALKLLNNFLSATAMAATSEAVAFGLANGLAMETVIDVVKASSGRNSAIDDKFPNQIATGRYDSGFRNTLMAKDVGLYVSEADAVGCHGDLGRLVAETWSRFADQDPGRDFTAVFDFIRQGVHGERS
jgi:3-hydroxyisobutyrate dehydrogenase-like beta-hydroxyacid dehydrogenase